MKIGSQARRKSLREFALTKEKRRREISPSAGQRTCKQVHEHFVLCEEGGELGHARFPLPKGASCTSTAPPFEKGGRKLFVKMTVRTPLSAS